MAMCGKKVNLKGLWFAVCGILIKHKLKLITGIKKQHYSSSYVKMGRHNWSLYDTAPPLN